MDLRPSPRAANPDDSAGHALSQACFECHEHWLFGVSLPSDYALVRIAASWSGQGRVFWSHGDAMKCRDFQLDPVLVGQLLVTRESMSSNASVWQRGLEAPDQVLAR